ncbi:hypothetical protein RFM68_29910 [Mesorhizobium sp. MSK_1335]|uniref:Glycerophosphoryl diester phosphodiesterase membrane domain-containing protein n=1 Tax=Mesorhizobium montanum TaxID=3072323 RepID=A0ABU4ZTL3_9HYPH|nr:hypothetical protein [Mesorhizobium sp. MSK_1335]MDX8528695.1 hypothetical protein [Mesorhizobium sp. MSK_1335]
MGNLGAAGPFRLGKVVADTVSFIGRNPVLVLAVAVVFFALPSLLIGLLTFAYRERAAYLVGGGEVEPFSVAVYVSFSLLAGLLGALPGFLGHAVLSGAMLGDINGHRPPIASCVGAAFRRAGPVLGIGVTIYLVWFFAQQAMIGAELLFPSFGGGVAFVLLVVPSVVWVLSALAAIPVAIREGLGAMASMGRSRALTKAYRWPIFGLFLLVLVLALALRVALFLGFSLAALMIAPAFVAIVGAAASACVTAIIWTVASIAATASYIDLRRAREGGGVDELVDVFS